MPPNPAAPTAGQRPSLRDRVSALRNIPPFLRQIWSTSKALTLVSLGLRLVRALLPIATLYVGKLIIDEAVRPAPVRAVPEPTGEAVQIGRAHV